MINNYVKAGKPVIASGDTWSRNPDWIPIPTLYDGDNEMYGVLAVYEEDERNYLALRVDGSTTSEVFWGDGTSEVMPNSSDVEKQYIYSATTSKVSVDLLGRNYKQVLVNIVFGGTPTVARLNRNAFGSSNRGNVSNWLDVIIDCSSASIQITSSGAGVPIPVLLERLRVLDHNTIGFAFALYQMPSLRILDYDMDSATTLNGTLTYCGNFLNSDLTPFSINNNVTNNTTNTFLYSQISEFGDITTNSATACNGMFQTANALRSVGDITFTANTTMQNFFIYDGNLESIGTITTSSALTNLQQAFNKCVVLKSIVFTECSGVTNTTNTFLNTNSLKELIVPNITIGFDIDSSSMQSDGLDALYDSLGTANGAQTIDITGNPGAATCDNTIATAKGWTIVG